MTDGQVRFIDTAGSLPPLWSRSVVFFANLLALFYGNEAQTESLADEVGEIDSYGARLMPIMNLLFRGGDNVLILERAPDPELCRYLSEDLGLSLPRTRVQKHEDYLRLREHFRNGARERVEAALRSLTLDRAEWIDGYVIDDTLTGVAEHLNCRTITSTDASRGGNNKLLLHRYLEENELPTFDTEIVESRDELAERAASLRELGYRSAVLRSQIGASGIGMLRLNELDNPEEFPAVPDYFFFEGPCLLQGWMEPGSRGITGIRSPSTQLFVDEEHVYAFDVTEQILSHDSIHQGNESPPPYLGDDPALREEMMLQGETVGRWLHGIGYRGTASIDWLIAERSGQGKSDLFVCEINARVTGATYPSLLARHFHPNGAWLLRNLRLRVPVTTAELLRMFEQPRHLFHPDRNSGILPLNLNFGTDDLVHKGQFLCIGETTEECHRLLNFAEEDLPVEWDADRD